MLGLSISRGVVHATRCSQNRVELVLVIDGTIFVVILARPTQYFGLDLGSDVRELGDGVLGADFECAQISPPGPDSNFNFLVPVRSSAGTTWKRD